MSNIRFLFLPAILTFMLTPYFFAERPAIIPQTQEGILMPTTQELPQFTAVISSDEFFNANLETAKSKAARSLKNNFTLFCDKVKRELGNPKGISFKLVGEVKANIASEVRFFPAPRGSPGRFQMSEDKVVRRSGLNDPASDIVYHCILEQTCNIDFKENRPFVIANEILTSRSFMLQKPYAYKKSTPDSYIIENKVLTFITEAEYKNMGKSASAEKESENKKQAVVIDGNNATVSVSFSFTEKLVNSPKNIKTIVAKQKGAIDSKVESFKTKLKAYLKDRKSMELAKAGNCTVSVTSSMKMTGVGIGSTLVSTYSSTPATNTVYVSAQLPTDIKSTVVELASSAPPAVTYLVTITQPLTIKVPAAEVENVNKGVETLLTKDAFGQKDTFFNNGGNLIEITSPISGTLYRKKYISLQQKDVNNKTVADETSIMEGVSVYVYGVRDLKLELE